jgi:hypothetical protein
MQPISMTAVSCWYSGLVISDGLMKRSKDRLLGAG